MVYMGFYELSPSQTRARFFDSHDSSWDPCSVWNDSR